MTTAAEYRRYAQEAIESAHVAQSNPVREQFLEIAKIWLMAAERMDADAADRQPESEKLAQAGCSEAASGGDRTRPRGLGRVPSARNGPC
jgi:hypothetical protein